MEDSDSLSQTEQKILKNLQKLEKFSAMKEFNTEDLNDIMKIVIETSDWIADSIDSADVELPLQILDLLEFLDEVNFEVNHKENRFRQQGEQQNHQLLNSI